MSTSGKPLLYIHTHTYIIHGVPGVTRFAKFNTIQILSVLTSQGETDAHDKAENGKKADLYMAPERGKMKICPILHF